MVPLISLSPLPIKTPTPWPAIWGFQWLLFRIMLGAGLIKIRGDKCWRDLTCMNYFYEVRILLKFMIYIIIVAIEFTIVK